MNDAPKRTQTTFRDVLALESAAYADDMAKAQRKAKKSLSAALVHLKRAAEESAIVAAECTDRGQFREAARWRDRRDFARRCGAVAIGMRLLGRDAFKGADDETQ